MSVNFKEKQENPFQVQISFHKLIENLEEIALSDVDYRSNYAKGLLKATEAVPELRSGITADTISTHSGLIRNLLADLFPTALTRNEIKAVTIPFHNITFNYTERFQNILSQAGSEFDMTIRDFQSRDFYIMSCCLILNSYYGYHVDYSQPFFYDIPDGDGILRHYKILYNADFIEIYPSKKAIDITPQDVDLLLDNFDDFELWKSKFKPHSWVLKGFGLMVLYENTLESAISTLKSSLLSDEEIRDTTQYDTDFAVVFRSIFKIPDLRLGYTEFDRDAFKFKTGPFGANIPSHLLLTINEAACANILCSSSIDTLIKQKKPMVISDVEAHGIANPEQNAFVQQLLAQNIKCCIFAPIVKNDQILGIIEFVSSVPKQLNSINANKLDFVLPFLTNTLDRYYSDYHNQVDAIIQKEYTAIHPSVYWKFRDEASIHMGPRTGKEQPFNEIIFKDVYPLYGQIDISGSSTARNHAIQTDLKAQLKLLIPLLNFLNQSNLPVIEQKIFELEKLEAMLVNELKADTEAIINNYIIAEIHPLLEYYKIPNSENEIRIQNYFSVLDPKIDMVYNARKDFDETLLVINKKMASILDKKQEIAQAYFPHYYERFKSDGVEHNLYIGASIVPTQSYNVLYLNNLRLWQLQAICEMENEYYRLRETLPYTLDVTSLILVYSAPMSIRFRMDEKRFDVDGTYNARYEVVKKRIDKSNIKGTNERITEKGKITIVYSQGHEEAEYRGYVEFLQHKKRLGKVIEVLEVEDLQGVTGLKALRVEVLYDNSNTTGESYTYDDLLKTLAQK